MRREEVNCSFICRSDGCRLCEKQFSCVFYLCTVCCQIRYDQSYHTVLYRAIVGSQSVIRLLDILNFGLYYNISWYSTTTNKGYNTQYYKLQVLASTVLVIFPFLRFTNTFSSSLLINLRLQILDFSIVKRDLICLPRSICYPPTVNFHIH